MEFTREQVLAAKALARAAKRAGEAGLSIYGGSSGSGYVVMHEDRLARFGFDLLQQVFKSYGTEIEVIERNETQTPEQELSRDLISIITSFSARLYGLRSHKTKRLISTAREVIQSPEP